MKTLTRVGAALFLLGFLLFLFVRLYLHYPLPVYEGELTNDDLLEPVEVYFDDYAVPHIYAGNEHDLFYVAGYIAARERLFQMTVTAAAVEGRLAELFGEKAVPDDIYLRTWGIPKMARILAENMHPDALTISTDFCDGINAYIDNVGQDLPFEFKLLRIKPLHWKPAHVAGFVRLMGHNLTSSWQPEIILGQAAYMFGEERVRQLLPVQPEDHSLAFGEYGELWRTLVVREQSLRKRLQMEGSHLGSNNWVISGSRTASGRPILANDPHLPFSQPARWFEMHLVGGRFNVSGACLAGVPVPVLGQNEACTWGFTNLMMDDIDFFVETTNPDSGNEYLHDGEWLSMDLREETIAVKSGGERTFVVRETIHGPVISDIHPLLSGEKPATGKNQVVAMQWTGHDTSDEVYSILRLNLMGNWEDFTEAAKTFGTPGQNVVYADTAGNIGWRPFLRIPVRKGGRNLVPMPGESSEWDWQGYVPFEEIPFQFNPKKGIIVTANNQVIDDSYPYYVSAFWEYPSRANRIWEMLGEREEITVEDVKRVQNDVVSPFAREVSPYFVSVFEGYDFENDSNLRTAVNLLRGWNGEHSVESAAAAVFNTAFLRLLWNVYGDEMELMGDGFYDGWLALPSMSQKNLVYLLRNERISWFDNVTTGNVELRGDILTRSLVEGVRELEGRLGPDPTNWHWGNLHRIAHLHAIGKDWPLLGKVFGLDVGPFEFGGANSTVSNGEYLLGDPFHVVNGPSFRRIVDFAQLDKTQFIIPTGQSGLPRSPHYADQAPLYHSGRYRTTYFLEETIKNSGFRRLLLSPSR
ncbi:MAG: penicillin acylase family protein [Candidatus Neomarinimicrobiota bacterium]